MTTTNTVNGTSNTGSTTTTSTNNSASMSDASDRFLKLLVTQMQNQDPLNPTDNAQITSQMAQINTVTGIDKLNTTMTDMSSNITQMQMMQGTSLVGHQVLLEGNKLTVGTDGTATAGYNLSAAAANVAIDIMDSAGNVVGSVTQTGMAAGQQGFQWTPPTGTSTTGLTFKVTATGGGKTIATTSLMPDMVDAVSTTSGSLNLELRNNGSTAYSKIVAVS
jgi:flagellar basal-body rod modification protein FlgD